MRVMIDKNILISAVIFKSKLISDFIKLLSDKHTPVLCSCVINELHEVVNEKFNVSPADLDKFFLELPFEFVYTPKILPQHNLFTIRDKDDEKILYSAILADVDVFVTGDKDFYSVDIERPEILSPADFLMRYC